MLIFSVLFTMEGNLVESAMNCEIFQIHFKVRFAPENVNVANLLSLLIIRSQFENPFIELGPRQTTQTWSNLNYFCFKLLVIETLTKLMQRDPKYSDM